MNEQTSDEQLNQKLTIFSIIFLGTLGVAAFLVLPALVMGMMTDLEFNQKQIGTVSTWQLIGIAVGSFLNLWLVKVLSWRKIVYLGVSCLLLGDFISMFFADYSYFIWIRFASGVAGGICISFAGFALGKTLLADKNFGLFLVFQVGFAIIANFSMPALIEAYGIAAIFICLITLEVIALLFLLKNIPNTKGDEGSEGGVNSSKQWFYCSLQLAAIFFFFVALGGFWTYIAPIGIDAGLSEQQTGTALSLGLFAAITGAFVAAQLNIKLGRMLPMLFAVGTQFIGLALLYSGFQFVMFVVAAGLFMFGWYMFYPYQLGLLAALDKDGRPMILSNAIAGIGSGLGPLIVSMYLGDNFLPAYIIAASFLFVAIFITVLLLIVAKKELATS